MAHEITLKKASTIEIDYKDIGEKDLDLSIFGFHAKMIFAFWHIKVSQNKHKQLKLIMKIL